MSYEESHSWELEQKRRTELENQRYKKTVDENVQKAKALEQILSKELSAYYTEEQKSAVANSLQKIKSQSNPKVACSESVNLILKMRALESDYRVKDEIRIKKIMQEEEKKRLERKNRIDALISSADDLNSKVAEEKISKDDKNSLCKRISKIKEELSLLDVNKEIQTVSFENQFIEIQSQIDEYAIKEDARRECVKAVFKILKSQDFTVAKPKVQDDGTVMIIASKPSGKTAKCVVDIEGKMNYRFDHYAEMTCLNDIEKFNVDLKKIYSIELKDEQVIWENPDRISHQINESHDEKRRTL